MEPNLTLDKAKRIIRQRDAVREQGTVLKGTIKEESLLEGIQPGDRNNRKQFSKWRQPPHPADDTHVIRHADDMGESHTHFNTVQPEMPHASSATDKDTLEHIVGHKRWLKWRKRCRAIPTMQEKRKNS